MILLYFFVCIKHLLIVKVRNRPVQTGVCLFAISSQVKIMKIIYPCHMNALVLITSRQLLKNIHISKLYIVV